MFVSLFTNVYVLNDLGEKKPTPLVVHANCNVIVSVGILRSLKRLPTTDWIKKQKERPSRLRQNWYTGVGLLKRSLLSLGR